MSPRTIYTILILREISERSLCVCSWGGRKLKSSGAPASPKKPEPATDTGPAWARKTSTGSTGGGPSTGAGASGGGGGASKGMNRVAEIEAKEVSFQWKNLDFLFRNPDLLSGILISH